MDSNTVWTVNDYMDGCIIGVADYSNSHCIYERIFDEEMDKWSENYYLTPISQVDFSVILHDWERWKKWRLDFDNNQRPISDWKQGIELEVIAKKSSNYRKAIQHGIFIGDWRYCEDMKVKWSTPIIVRSHNFVTTEIVQLC